MPAAHPDPHRRVVDQPQPGFFLMRLVKGGPLVAAKIELTEDGKWAATINGKEQSPRNADPIKAAGVLDIWHSGSSVPESEYNYRLSKAQWAQANKPDDPAANPTKKINLRTMAPVFEVAEEV